MSSDAINQFVGDRTPPPSPEKVVNVKFYKLLFKSVDPSSKKEVEQTYLIPEASLTPNLREKLLKTGNCALRNPQLRFIPQLVLNQQAPNKVLGVANTQTHLIQNVQTYPTLLRGGQEDVSASQNKSNSQVVVPNLIQSNFFPNLLTPNLARGQKSNLDIRTQNQTLGVTPKGGSGNSQNPIQSNSSVHFLPNLSLNQPPTLARGQKSNLDVRNTENQTTDVAPKGRSNSQNPIQSISPMHFFPNLFLNQPPTLARGQKSNLDDRNTENQTFEGSSNSQNPIQSNSPIPNLTPGQHLDQLPPILTRGQESNPDVRTTQNKMSGAISQAIAQNAIQSNSHVYLIPNLPRSGQQHKGAGMKTVTPPNSKVLDVIDNATQSNPQALFIIPNLSASQLLQQQALRLRGREGVGGKTNDGSQTALRNLILNPSQQNITFVPLVSAPVISSKVYKCRTCSQVFPTPAKLRIHRYKAHKGKIHACDKCGKSFHVLSTLNAHKLVHTDDRKFPCGVCGKVFKSEVYVKSHLRTHAAKVKTFACDACDKKFPTAQQVKYHNNIEHLNKRYKCNVCQKEYRQITSLNLHLTTHDPLFVKSSVKCDECDATFSHKNAVRGHKLRMHLGNLYVCDVCGKEITNAAGFKIHVRTHTGEKPFVCEFCGKAFISKNRLNMHVRIHTKEKPYPCKVCGKRFTQVGSVTVHVRRVHRHEKQYQCKVCSKKYVSKDQLKIHTKSHVGLTTS